MRRLVRIETAFLAGAIEAQRSHEEIFHPDDIQPGREGESQLLGAGLLGRTQALLRLARYDAHLSRRYYRAIAELGRLRKLERAAEQYRESKTTKQSQYPEPYDESARYRPPPGPQGWTPTGGDGPHSRPPPQPPILPRPPAPTPPIVDDPQLTAYKKQTNKIQANPSRIRSIRRTEADPPLKDQSATPDQLKPKQTTTNCRASQPTRLPRETCASTLEPPSETCASTPSPIHPAILEKKDSPIPKNRAFPDNQRTSGVVSEQRTGARRSA